MAEGQRSFGRRVSASALPSIIGLASFVAALSMFRSYENRPVFGLWSYPFAAVLAASVTLWVVITVRSVVSARRGRAPSPPARLLGLSVFSWGVGSLVAALDDPTNGARVLDGAFFGTAVPFTVGTDWLSLVLLVAAAIWWLVPRLDAARQNILLSASALAFLLLVGEAGVRLRAVVAPRPQGFPTLTQELWTRRHAALNSEGFRDIEHEKPEPDDRRRVLLVGDSFAFGFGVDRIEDRFGEVLARELSRILGEPWESVSSAVPNSHTMDELGFLEQMAGYERSAVVLLYVFNDIDYLATNTGRASIGGSRGSAFDRIHPVRLLYSNSYLFQELYVNGRLAAYRWLAQSGDSEQPSVSPYADEELLQRHLDDLEEFVTLASRDRVPVVIVPWDVWHPEGGGSPRHDLFVEAALDRGLPIVTLIGAFANHEPSELRVNRLDDHPNELAHRLAAEWAAAPIARRLTSAND